MQLFRGKKKNWDAAGSKYQREEVWQMTISAGVTTETVERFNCQETWKMEEFREWMNDVQGGWSQFSKRKLYGER